MIAKPKFISKSPEVELDQSYVEVENKVNNVISGLEVSKDVNFDRNNLMRFDENGRLVPKFDQDDCNARNKLMHATLSGPDLISHKLEIKTASSPEKLNLKSKISIFDDKRSVDMNLKSEIPRSTSIKYEKEQHKYKERSASFTNLVGFKTHEVKNLSRMSSSSVGASLDKNIPSVQTPSRPRRISLRNVKVSQSFDVDSPGKRKASPESSNLYLENRGSGKRTIRDR